MLNSKKIAVILPAYNASKTLKQTINELPINLVDEIILVDDGSSDGTAALAKNLGIKNVITHPQNRGYGANQKTCYSAAIELNCEIIIMVHPDYQYTPKLVTAMAAVIAYDVYPVVFGSRILGNKALAGGMPLYKYIANRLLTFFQNLMLSQKLSEYHTGFRAFNAKVLNSIPYRSNSDDFIFDNEIAAQIFMANYEIGEISCPTHYFKEASSINFRRSVVYGLGVLRISIMYRLEKSRLFRFAIFKNLEYNDKK